MRCVTDHTGSCLDVRVCFIVGVRGGEKRQEVYFLKHTCLLTFHLPHISEPPSAVKSSPPCFTASAKSALTKFE